MSLQALLSLVDSVESQEHSSLQCCELRE